MLETNRLTNLDPAPAASGDSPPQPPTEPVGTLHPTGEGSRFRISPETIEATCQTLPPDLAESLRWAARYCRLQNLTPMEFASKLRKNAKGETYSDDSVRQAFQGRRETGALKKFCAAIDELRQEIETSLPKAKHPFVKTTCVRRVWDLCDATFEDKSIGFIIGATQTGKSTAIASYQAEHNHGRTYMVRMPTRGSLCDLIYRIAGGLGIPRTVRMQDLRTRIMRCFSPQVMLIVDEVHQCCLGQYGDRALITIEWLREVADTTGCPLVICGTDVLKHALQSSPILSQLWQRRAHVLQLPKTPPISDLIALEKSFGLSAAPNKTFGVEIEDADGQIVTVSKNPAKLRQQILERDSFGHYAKILQQAAAFAAQADMDLTWENVIDIHHQLDEAATA